MSIPLLDFAPSSQNARVASFEIPGDEQPRIFTTAYLNSNAEMDLLIRAAYRQIFHEQQMLDSHRQAFLESQLRSSQISVKEFIRGLATSDIFRRLNYDSNSNYRFVELCVQRILGRQVYSEREKLAWSIVLASQGLVGFIDSLINSEEYQSAFGEDTVPYQRRRILPQRNQGDLPFERMSRYGKEYRDQLLTASNSRRLVGEFNPDMLAATPWSRVSLVLLAAAGLVFFLLSFNSLIAH